MKRTAEERYLAAFGELFTDTQVYREALGDIFVDVCDTPGIAKHEALLYAAIAYFLSGTESKFQKTLEKVNSKELPKTHLPIYQFLHRDASEDTDYPVQTVDDWVCSVLMTKLKENPPDFWLAKFNVQS